MATGSREFQVFAKPVGARCNLACSYCYYLPKHRLPGGDRYVCMAEDLLEAYIIQHIKACTDTVIRFSWHGGEPALLGLAGFQRIVALQKKHCPAHQAIANGIQTNGTLLNDAWYRFLADERFTVGISLDGPEAMHDCYRKTREGKPTHAQVLRACRGLREHGVVTEILCVVSAHNARYPAEVYSFFQELGVHYITFLPLVEAQPNSQTGVSDRTVTPDALGDFLCTVFDLWQAYDIGRIKVQIFEEASRTAFNLGHTLCIFREVCGGVPVLEHNGDVYSCDHYVDPQHRLGNIRETPLAELLDSPAQRAFGQAKWDTLPSTCRDCAVRVMCNGGCPRNRFARTSESEPGLNYLCSGYKRFFTHCLPFIDALGAAWRAQSADD